ncbi:hypothetical protein ABR738_00580 [Streptomyces sp. Edi4]|uniref:hypothetical protein n=1 Tax=Streptomyces sp. Edi4 TaxID=3162527 RepID=UPI0033061B00
MSPATTHTRPRADAAADQPPPPVALTVDHLGRPLCDGTTHRATRNCARLADFRLERPGAQAVPDHACERHVGQVAATQNGGESGPSYEHRLIPIRTKE